MLFARISLVCMILCLLCLLWFLVQSDQRYARRTSERHITAWPRQEKHVRWFRLNSSVNFMSFSRTVHSLNHLTSLDSHRDSVVSNGFCKASHVNWLDMFAVEKRLTCSICGVCVLESAISVDAGSQQRCASRPLSACQVWIWLPID